MRFWLASFSGTIQVFVGKNGRGHLVQSYSHMSMKNEKGNFVQLKTFSTLGVYDSSRLVIKCSGISYSFELQFTTAQFLISYIILNYIP